MFGAFDRIGPSSKAMNEGVDIEFALAPSIVHVANLAKDFSLFPAYKNKMNLKNLINNLEIIFILDYPYRGCRK